MSIAIVSIGGVLKSSRESTFKETALSIINGVKMQLTVANQLKEGNYYFNSSILDSDNELSFGGKIHYATGTEVGSAITGVTGITFKAYSKVDESTCTQKSPSYVSIKNDSEKYTFSICLTPTPIESSSQKFIRGTEEDLYKNDNTAIQDVDPNKS